MPRWNLPDRTVVAVAAALATSIAAAGPWQPWGPAGWAGGDEQTRPYAPVVAAHPQRPGDWVAALSTNPPPSTYVFPPAFAGLLIDGSPDGGGSWQQRSTVPGYYGEFQLKVASGGEHAYVNHEAGLLRSQDRGVTWTPLSGPCGYLIGVHPTGLEIVCGMPNGTEGTRSENAGSSWAVFAIPFESPVGAVDWTTRRVYLGGRPDLGPMASKPLDTGTAWSPGPSAVTALAASNGNALAAAQGQLWYAPDGGQSWSTRPILGGSFPACAVAYAPTQPAIAYAIEGSSSGVASPHRVIRSDDGGATWRVMGTVADDGGQNPTLAVEAGSGNRLVYSANFGTYRSIDGGTSWELVPRSGGYFGPATHSVLFDATDPAARWLRSASITPRSTDGGITWHAIGAHQGKPVQVIGTSPARSGLVFGTVIARTSVGDQSDGVLRSIDGGTTWTPTTAEFSGSSGEGMPVVLAGATADEFFAFTNLPLTPTLDVPRVFRSVDEGVSWTQAAAPPAYLHAVVRAPGAGLVLYAGVEDAPGSGGLYRSSDHAASWQEVPLGTFAGSATAIAVAPTNVQRIVVAVDAPPERARLIRSDDGGATWSSIWQATPGGWISSIAFDPADAAVLYVSVEGQGVFRSADAGATWAALDQGLTDKRVGTLTFDPRTPTRLFASTPTGAYVVDLSTGVPAGHRWAIEYFHAAFDHYFVSADTDEIAGLDSGAFAGWARTGESFRVGPTPSPDQAPVCRFFGIGFAPLSSHFYTPYPDECASVMLDPKWQYEKIAFGSRLPEASKGCLPGYVPLYRLWNRNRDGAPNHRYTSSLLTFAQMDGSGLWKYEGEEDTLVFACVPF